jgi:hypothetical protein
MFRHAAAAVFLVALLVNASGCSCSSSGPQRRAIHGKVVTARPVQSFALQPLGEAKAPAVSTVVTNGEYRFTREDGPIPGEYRVVFAFVDQPSGFGTNSKKELIVTPAAQTPPPPPPAVNVTVPAEGPLEFNIVIP